MRGSLNTALSLQGTEILQLVVSDCLQPIIWYCSERQWNRVITSNEGMAKSLQRRHPILRVNL